MPLCDGLPFGHSDTTERGVDEKPVYGDPVRQSPGATAHLVENDLGVVDRRMGEGAVSVDIAQSENTFGAGLAKIVDLDVTPFVELDTGRFSVEQVRVRDPPDSDEEVGAGQQALVATPVRS